MNDTINLLPLEYRVGHRASFLVRLWLEKISIRKFIGINLAGISFFAAVIMPQSQTSASTLLTYFEKQDTYIPVVLTDDGYRWPLEKFGISQNFHFGHPGMDLPNPLGTSVYPIDEGKVAAIIVEPWGYGRHIIISHSDTLESLYAHLSMVTVTQGQLVKKTTKLGEVGSTGWSTGNHLHLEIHDHGVAINPLEVLPGIQQSVPHAEIASSEQLFQN